MKLGVGIASVLLDLRACHEERRRERRKEGVVAVPSPRGEGGRIQAKHCGKDRKGESDLDCN